jgi:hypothetical protein
MGCDQRFDLLALGEVAGDQLDVLGAGGAQRGDEFCVRAGRLGAAARGEDQVAHAVGLDQMAGERAPEGAGGAGDEHRARGVEPASAGPTGSRLDEPRHQRSSSTPGELGLAVVCQRGDERRLIVGSRLARRQIQRAQHPPRVLGAGAAQQAVKRGLLQIDLAVFGCDERAAGEPDDRDGLQPRLGEQLLEPGQGRLGERMRRLREVRVRGRLGECDQDALGPAAPLVQALAQG